VLEGRSVKTSSCVQLGRVAAMVLPIACLALAPLYAQGQESDDQASHVLGRKDRDAAVDRNILLPSAETLSKGDIAVNSYELLLLGMSVGVTDAVELSATSLVRRSRSTPPVSPASSFSLAVPESRDLIPLFV